MQDERFGSDLPIIGRDDLRPALSMDGCRRCTARHERSAGSGSEQDDVGVFFEQHRTLQRFHKSRLLHTSEPFLERLGGISGEWGALLQRREL